MPSITFDQWQGGMDRRQPRGVANGATFHQLTNCYVTTGYKLRKRPAWRYAAAIETTAPAGLFAALGELHSFSHNDSGTLSVMGDDGILYTHNTHETPHASGNPIADVLDAKAFQGFIYAITRDTAGNIEHHYVDGTSPPRITDVNAPTDATQIVVAEGKLWGIDGDNVRFCATGDARDWTTGGDAGFLAAASNSPGGNPVAIGLYQGQLAVFSVGSVQLWAIDPDPANHDLVDVIENAGTQYPHTLVPIGGDLYFVDAAGQARSLSRLQLVDDVSDVDIGAPIEEVSSEVFAHPSVQRVTGHWLQKLGHMWVMNDEVASHAPVGSSSAIAFAYSRTSKLSAWSQLSFQPGDYKWFAALGTQFFAHGVQGNLYRLAFTGQAFSDHRQDSVGVDWGSIAESADESLDRGTLP